LEQGSVQAPLFRLSTLQYYMATTFKHLLCSSAIGFVLAGLLWLAAWFGSAWDSIHTLWPALALGAICAGIAGVIMSLQARGGFQSSPGPVKTSKPARNTKKKRRRHPLNRPPYRARITPALRWLALSKPLQRLLRSSDGSLVGKPVFSLLHPEDVSAVDQAFSAALAGRRVQRVTCRFLVATQWAEPARKKKAALRSDTKLLPPLEPASFVYVRFDIWAKRDRAGKVSRFVCRFVDLTPQVLQSHADTRRARKELAKARRRIHAVGQDLARLKLSYRELYQHAPVMYFSLDIDGKIVTCNDTLIHTLGYERHEMQNQSYTLLLAPPILKSYVTIAESMPSQEGELETLWQKKDGTQIDVWLHTVPVYDEDGHFVRYRSAALDLTEKNRLANESRARGDELERTNQRLLFINSELEAFTHVVSHDLKEPLRTLQAYSHILAEEHAAQLGPDGFQYINHLVRASRRLGTLIDELLNLSRAGRITRAPQVFNVLEVVATVRQDLVDLIQRKQATILTEGSLPTVIGDMARITQLVTNLVANGLKYNQHPVPQVVIGSKPCEDDPAHIAIYVRDNGIGIDPTFHQQIFGIFRRLHQDDKYEGTGAGLAICKKIVEGHGGRIWVESTPGQGATFYFTLPFPPQPDSAPGKGVPQTKSLPLHGASPQRRTALKVANAENAAPRLVLVEDQADVAMVIQKLGKRDGLDITWFPTAEEAWQHLQQQDADLLLLDVNLPGISGVELCRRIRTLAHLRETPVAMFTPDQEPEQQAEYREAGADFFLTKDLLCQPVAWQRRIQELLDQIRQPLPH
jgi:PAS domain S-box-containing protein